MACQCSTTDTLSFATEIAGVQLSKVHVTVTSECQETSEGCQVTYTVTNLSLSAAVASLTVAGDTYIFGAAPSEVINPSQTGTVTVTRPGGECTVTSGGSLALNFPSLELGGVIYGGICVCTLSKTCG
jgi:hypothetical protein